MNDHMISRNRFLDKLVLDADRKTDIILVHQALEEAVVEDTNVPNKNVGEWIPDFDLVHCSVCGAEELTREKSKYCPSCGARMKGAEDG